MSDKIKQSIEFDASSATAELAKLTANIEKYNGVVKASTELVRAQNRITNAAVGRLDTFNTRITEASRQLDPVASRLADTNAGLKNVNRRLVTSNNRYATLNSQLKEHSRSLSSATLRAQNLSDKLKDLNSSLQKDASAILQGVALLRRFNKEMKGVISTMKVKNANLRNQAAAARADASATGTLSAALQRLQDHIRSVIRVAQGFLLHRAVAAATAAMRDAVVAAKDLSIRIAEIQTISQDAAKSVASWQRELVELSNTFGLDATENAEGAYQALSNQVVQAGNATAFLRRENELALVGVSTLSEATSVTTSVLNAYGESSSRARERNAQLFKTVELGRLRLGELGDTLGRVNILSNQLGITFEEQQAAIATLTRQGIRAQEAITLLRNIELKLIKPTERMSELFEDWGVQSGQAAIATFGFTGVINKMIQEMQSGGNAAAEIGQIFGRLRAIVGFTGLSGAFDQFNDNLNEIKNSGPAAARALEISLNSFGKRAEIQIQKIKNLFLVEFGGSILRSFVQISESFGGADKLLRRILELVKTGATLWVSYKVAVIGVATAQAILNARFLVTNAQGQILAGQTIKSLTTGMAGLRIATAGVTLGLTLLAPYILDAITGFDDLNESVKAAGNNIDEELTRRLDRVIAKFDQRVTTMVNNIKAETTQGLRAFNLFAAGVNREITALDKDIDQRFKSIGRSIKVNVRDAIDKANQGITALRRNIRQIQTAQQGRGERVGGLRLDLQEDQLRFNTRDQNEVRQIVALNELKKRLNKEAIDALSKGEDKAAQTLFSRVQRLHQEVVRRTEQIRRDAESKVSQSKRVVRFDPLTGRNRVVTERTQTTKDPDTAEAAGKVLKQLEKDRLDIVRQRILLEEQNIRNQQKFLAQQKAEEARRTKATQALQDTLAVLDQVKRGDGTSIQQFDQLLGQAKRQAEAAGIDGGDSVRLFRSLQAKRIEIARSSALEIAKQQRDIASKALQEIEDRVKKAQQNAKKNLTSPLEALQPLRAELEKQAKELKAFLVGVGANKELVGTVSGKRQRNPLDGAFKTVEEVLAGIGDLDKAEQPIVKAKEQLIELRKILIDITERSDIGGLFGPDGKLGFVKEIERRDNFPVVGDQTTLERAQQLTDAEDEFNAALKRGVEARKSLNEALRQQAIIREKLAKLPKDIQEQAAAQADKRIDREQALNKVLDGTIERLERIRKLNQQIGNAARPEPTGAEPQRFANGGFAGRDRIPALLSRGESVLNPVATRAFAPLVSALNSSRPGFGNQNTTSYNFGDINVTSQGGNVQDIGPHIVAHIKRAIRQNKLQI